MASTRWGTALSGWLALSGAALGCSDAHPESPNAQFLPCESNGECVERGARRCGDEGFCVDASGQKVTLLPDGGLGSADAGSGSEAGRSGAGAGSAGTSAAGSGPAGSGGSAGRGGSGGSGSGSSGSGGSGGGAVDAGVGIVLPSCGSSMSSGASCSGRDDQPVPECCQGNGTHLRCAFDVCTNSIPASCSGNLEAVPGSTLCGGYQPCAGKSCGDPCSECDPADRDCMETDVVRTCDRSGRCATGNADCSEPMSCDPFAGGDPCPMGQACCEVGRCGPVGTSDGVCEPADPTTGGCMPCACEMEPGGCPRCNAPDTPILTPDGERAIASLREGDLVMSLHGGRMIAVPIARTRQMQVANHAVVRLSLDGGEPIEVSGSHPTADGRRLDSLQPGDVIGGRTVSAIELVPYALDRTYDILPASDSGTYVAGGALLGSTLWPAPP